MSISNEQFWNYWRNGRFNEALACAVKAEKKPVNRLQTMLFGTPEQLKQTGLITTISVGEFLYDYMMINPTVVRGLDFARTEDLSSLFSLSQFSSTIDTADITGDIAQLQGYVAEQMVAAELQAKGHDVEFPEDPNNPGWDILVDGHPFQVKDLANPEGVKEHLENYPDIPVYVNKELAPYFEDNPDVYVSTVSREDVLEATTSTINHASDLLDFEIPWITAAVSTLYNIKRVWKDDVAISQAVFNVVSDTSSRAVLGALGQFTGKVAGVFLFGPAGGILGSMLGAYAGASQGWRLSTSVKRLFSKQHEEEWKAATVTLINNVVTQIDKKLEIKKRKIDGLSHHLTGSVANEAIGKEIERRGQMERKYLINKKEELISLSMSLKNGSVYVLEVFPTILATIAKSGVHPVHFQDEMQRVQQAANAYRKKM